jgi:hypothetical protein
MNEKFEFQELETIDDVLFFIEEDEGKCVQQVVFSTYHNALTQINFTKKVIRSNIEL